MTDIMSPPENEVGNVSTTPTIEEQERKSITDTSAEKITSPSQQQTFESVSKTNREALRQVKNPFKTLTPRVTQLVYWENPTHSGAALAIGLLFLIYTTQYSLFNTFCALAVISLGLNWIYVVGRKQLQAFINQEPINPHEYLLVNKPWYIERKDAEKYLDTTIEAVNFLLLEIQKIVLVDDPMRTVRYAFIFYVLWTLGCWISIRTFIGIGFVLGFTTPIAYQKNKALVDEKLDQANKLTHSYLDRGLNVAKQHTGGIYEKAKSFAANKGLVSESTARNTKKEE